MHDAVPVHQTTRWHRCPRSAARPVDRRDGRAATGFQQGSSWAHDWAGTGEGPSKYELLGPSGLTEMVIFRSTALLLRSRWPSPAHRGELPRRMDHLLQAIPLSPEGVRRQISTPADGSAQGVSPCELGEFSVLGVSSTDRGSSSTGMLRSPQVSALPCGFSRAAQGHSCRDPEAGSGVTQG